MTIKIGDGASNLLLGTSGADQLFGKGGDDILSGGGESDYLSGGGDNDLLVGGLGADTLDGGTGNDTASYELATSAVWASLADGGGQRGEAKGDVFMEVENLRGSHFADLLTGDDGANRLLGDAGADGLYGHGGKDQLYGGGDNDTLDGGSGVDKLFGESGEDALTGGAGADEIWGGTDFDYALYTDSAGGVTVNLTTGTGSGFDAEGDKLSGIEGLVGSDFADKLTGDGAFNTLTGGAGGDTLSGKGGQDLLFGGTGADTLSGGSAADTFRYIFTDESKVGAGKRDVITDFNHGEGDRIDLHSIAAKVHGPDPQATSFHFIGQNDFTDEGQLRFYHSGGDTILQMNTDSSHSGVEMEIVLQGNITPLSSDFIL